MTNKVKQLCSLIDVVFLDHIVVAKGYPWYSFEEFPTDYSSPENLEALEDFAYATYFKNNLEAFKQYCLKKGFRLVKRTDS